MDGTPAVDAGLREDDVIMSLNGNSACRDSGDVVASFKKMIEQQKIGQMVTMDILRGNQKFSLTAKLAELPIHHQPEAGHRHIEECPDSVPSMLERVLHASNALSLFKSITDGLYFRSNIVHNWSA
jgi:C-terminal processing protease CtpA/Prc